jgi:hypothetical protein
MTEGQSMAVAEDVARVRDGRLEDLVRDAAALVVHGPRRGNRPVRRPLALDLVDGHGTERTGRKTVRAKPIPFPPEPLRRAGITLTRRALRGDRRDGRRRPGCSPRTGSGWASTADIAE